MVLARASGQQTFPTQGPNSEQFRFCGPHVISVSSTQLRVTARKQSETLCKQVSVALFPHNTINPEIGIL